MISYITSEPDVNRAFDAYLSSLASALRGMGLDAVRTEHNDVLVGGRKVSGNACYATSTGCIVHGTMLYDTDFTEMERAITPSKEKLDSKGIKSVRQRAKALLDKKDIDLSALVSVLEKTQGWDIFFDHVMDEIRNAYLDGRLDQRRTDYLLKAVNEAVTKGRTFNQTRRLTFDFVIFRIREVIR